MNLLVIGNGALLSVVALGFAIITPSHAESDNKVEAGRLQICKIAGSSAAQNEIEIPVDGKYAIAAAKAGSTEPILIVQTDFSTNLDSMSQAKNNSALKDKFKLENRDGKLIVRLNLNASSCIYLNAEAPVLKNSNLTLSGTHVVPDWIAGADGANIGGLSYRYFNSIDQTYFVASVVGNTLSFAVHDSKTGSNLSHDKVNRVAVVNSEVLNLVPIAFKANLERHNQYDINLIDLEKMKINVKDLDFQNSSDVSELVTQLTKILQPPPHSRLILALPKRGPVQMKFTNTTLVGNRLEGLGFYRDSTLNTVTDSGYEITVPIDAFINFQSAVIDIDSGRLVSSQSYSEGHLFFSSPYPEPDLADSITDRKKMLALNGVVNVGVAKVMNSMFEVK